MTGDSSNQTKNREVWAEAYKRVEENLNKNKNFSV